MNKRPAIISLVTIVVSCLAGWAGKDIAFANQWGYFEALRTTASIVLAIMGAWVTILYPKALEEAIKDPGGKTATENKDRITALLLPVKLSTVVLLVVLILGPASLLLKQSLWLVDHLLVMRGISFGLLVTLTVAEIAAVILTIWPIEAARSEVNALHRRNSDRAALFTLVRKQ